MAGRPKTIVNWEEIENYLKLGATLDDVARLTNISRRTLQRRCESDFNHNFDTLIKNNMINVQMSVRQALLKKVREGDTTSIIYANKTLGGLIEAKDQVMIELKKQSLEIEREKQAIVINTNIVNDEMVQLLTSNTIDLEKLNKNGS